MTCHMRRGTTAMDEMAVISKMTRIAATMAGNPTDLIPKYQER